MSSLALTEEVSPPVTREQEGRSIVQRYALAAGGIGLVPAPVFDELAIAGVIGKMVYDLGQLYTVPTPHYRTKAIVATLLGGLHSAWITRYLASYALLLFPGIGYLASATIRPVVSGAVVYAIGFIFIKQFSHGHTLDSFDTNAAKQEFERGFAAGKAFMQEQLTAR